MSAPDALGGSVIATGNSAQDSIQNNGFMIIYKTSSGDRELLETLDYCDFTPILEERQRKRTPNTCQWITEEPEFRRWQSEENFLWIFGMPGSGKSFIAHYLYEHLVDDGQVSLHFFFDSKSTAAQDLNSLKKFYPTILHQLLRRASRKPDITRQQCFDVSRQRLLDGDTSSAALRMAIRDVLGILGSAYLVIDAVDECTDADDEALDAWLGEIKQLPGVKTVVTSRSSQKLDTLAKRAQCISLNLSSNMARSNRDIRLFIKHRLQKSANPEFSGMGEVAEQVAEKSKGMMLYARLMLDILEQIPGDKEAYNQKLNRLPTGLSSLYAAQLSEIVNFNEATEFVKSIFQWLVTCRRPPTIETLWGVDAVRRTVEQTPTRISKAGFVHFLRQHCLPLVEIFHDNTVRFVHTTVAQFLKGEDIEGEGDTCPERFQIKISDGHEHIAIVSLRLLSWNVAWGKGASLDYKDLQEYAILEWPTHFKHSAKQIMQDKGKRNLILSFCRHENFRPWLTARAASDVAFRIYFGLDGGPIYPKPLHIAVYFDIWELANLFVQDVNGIDATQSTPLHIAAGRSSSQIARHLMGVGANLSATDRNGSLPLHRAVRRGKWETVKELCYRDCTRINTRDNYKLTPLHVACQLGWTRCVEVLLAHNAEVITDDNPDQSPIALAVENGHFGVVRELLRSDQGLIAHCGRPLIEAARRGSLETVRFLYEQGASLIFKGKFGQTALHKACIAQNKDLVDYLLSKDLDPNPVDDSKRTPLYYAAEKGNLYIVNALIAKNANVNFLDRRQETALFKPAGKGHVDVVRRLLEAGTDATKLDKWQRTPLRFAAMYGHPDVVAVLLKKTAIKQNIPDWEGRTVLHNAAAWLRKGQEDVIDILFKYKAEARQTDKNHGITALHAALLREEGQPPPTLELIKRLIHYHVPIDARDMSGRTALYLAVVTQHAEAVKLLLKAGANTNDNSFHEAVRRRDGAIIRTFLEIKPRINLSERDRKYQTPLHIAANNGDKETVTQLLDADAPTQSLDQYHMTPLMCAQKQGNPEIIQLFMDKDPIPSGDYVSRVANGVWKRSLLHWLVTEGKDLSQVLLDRSTLNAQDVVGRTPLHLAVMSKSLVIVQHVVSAEVDTNIADESSFTPLHYAAENEEAAILQAIVSAPGINIDETDRWNRTALYLAANKGNSENVRILLDIGVSFTPDYDQRTPLHAAIDEGHDETVNILLQSKQASDLIRARDARNRSVLHLISCQGKRGILKHVLRLVDDTSFIDGRDASGQTALHLASKYGHCEVVKELLAAGATAHILDNYRFLAVHFAAEAGYTAIVGALLDAIPASVDKCLSKWQQRRVSLEEISGSAVLYALLLDEALEQVERGWYLTRPELLEPDKWAHLTYKVKDDLMTWDRQKHSIPGTTLMRAVMGGHPDVVRVILEKVPNMPLHAWSYHHQDALQLAAGRGYHSIVEQFIDAGANVNHNVENHETSLHQAAQNGHEAVITLLLRAGANPSTARMTDGATPLHLAAENGHSGVVRQLVRVTFIDVTDDMRQTPLHRACLRNHKAAIEMLLDAEANPLAQDISGKTPLAIISELDETLRLRMQEQAIARPRLEERGE